MIRLIAASLAALILATAAYVLLSDTERLPSNESGAGPHPTAGPPNATPFFAGLDPEKEKFIWDTEHFTFELETYVGKPIAAAIRHRQPKAVKRFFAPEFQGVPLDRKQAQQIQKSGLTEYLVTAADTSSHVDADTFADWLISRLPADDTISGSRFRVLHISKDDNSSSTDDWVLDCLLTVSARRPDNTLRFLEQHSTVRCRFQNDDQIRAGGTLLSWRVDSESLREGPQLMTEVTADYGLDKIDIHDNWKTPDSARQYNKQLAVTDFDHNGLPDIAVATMDGQVILLANNKRGFHDVTTDCGLPPRLPDDASSMLVTWLDFDNDGFEDLLLGKSLYRNRDGTRFEPVRNCNLDIGFNPMGSAVADYDADGLDDIYIFYQHSPNYRPKQKPGWVSDDQSGAPNQLWRNLGNGRFENTTTKAGVAAGRKHSFAAVWLHANDDHWPDLYVANDFAENTFLLNNGNGTFTDISQKSRTADFATSMGVAAGDLTGDGRTDIYVANMYSKMGRRILAQVSDKDYPPGTYEKLTGACAGNRLYRASASGDLSYEDISEAAGVNTVGWAYAPALADFDCDGLLDIYATAGFLSFRRDKPDG